MNARKSMLGGWSLVVLVAGIHLAGCASPSGQETAEALARAQKKKTTENVRELVLFSENYKFGYKTKSDVVVIPATFDNAREFRGGLAQVHIGATNTLDGLRGGKWGYIDERGVAVIPMVFMFTRDFSHGLAHVVTFNWESGYIDTTGRTVIKLARHTSGGDFSEGLAAVSRSVASGTNRKHFTDYIDTQGQVVLTVPASGKEFHEGLAAASIPNSAVPPGKNGSQLYGFIDRKGEWVIPPAYFDAAEFSGGRAPVCVQVVTDWSGGERWGYIDPAGKMVIEAQFNEVHPFYKGFALVHSGGERAIVLHGPREWLGGKWLVIDRDGKVHKTSSKWIDVRKFADEAEAKR